MNYTTEMKKYLNKDVFPLFKSMGFKRKQHYFIREVDGRQDVIEIIFQRNNRASHASFSFAIGFIAPITYRKCTGRKQPFLFSKKILFYVPFGVILCAKEDFVAGFDYTYEIYAEQECYDALPYVAYQESRPDFTREQFDKLNTYYEYLHQRYHHQTMIGLHEAVQEDLESVVNFFNQLPADKEIISTFSHNPPKGRLAELLYFALEDYANQHGQMDVAVSLRMQLNNRRSKKGSI